MYSIHTLYFCVQYQSFNKFISTFLSLELSIVMIPLIPKYMFAKLQALQTLVALLLSQPIISMNVIHGTRSSSLYF